MDEIVITDNEGSIINSNNLNDWTQFNQNESEQFTSLFTSLTKDRYVDGIFQDLTYYDCGFNDSINVIVYQNPVPESSSPILKIESNIEIIDLGLTSVFLGDDESYIDGGIEYYLDSSNYVIEIPLEEFLTNYQRNDFTLFCMIVTSDSCTYYTKGNIKFE